MATQLPAGMRNYNPGNIKYIGQPGTTPSVNTDQGDPQAVYATPEAGMSAMYQLLMKKYGGGKVTPAMIIAGEGGWTPGNTQAAQNIAATLGIGINDDIGLTNPAKAVAFMKALTLQEHGPASSAYTNDMYANAVNASMSGNGAAVNVPSAAFPYRLYGGATREDAITGLNRQFNDALTQLYNAAPPEVQRELGLNSAYRSKEVQQALWDKSDKTGHSVAAPGKSRHQFGEAADLYGFGLTKDQVSQATRDWVTQNAQKYGLAFPMAHEPWHIQLARSMGQAGAKAQVAAPPAYGGPGEGAGRFGGTGLGTPAANPYAVAKKDKKSGWETFGEGIGDAATAMAAAGKGIGYNIPAQPGAARVDVQPVSSIDPQRAEQQRQMLAFAMQRLNSGNLWG